MKVKSLYLQNSITIPGTKVLGTTSILQGKHGEVEMELSGDQGVVLWKTMGQEGAIPLPNISLMIFLDAKDVKKKSKE